MDKIIPITDNKIFCYLYKNGKSVVTSKLVIYYRYNNLGINRIGITASKKIGSSVVRNRAKRLIRESYRVHSSKINQGYDIVFVCRLGINGCKAIDVEKSMWYIFKKSNLFKKELSNH